MTAHASHALEIPYGVRHARRKGREHLKRRIQVHTKSAKNIVIHPSLRAQARRIVLFVVLTILMFCANVWYPWSVQHIPLGVIFGHTLSLALPLFAIPPLAIFILIVWVQQNRRYILCKDYILEIEGLMSYTLRTVRLRYLHIRGLEIDQNLLQQALNVGDLRVGGEVSPEDTDIVMSGIYNPSRYKELIKKRIEEKLIELSHVSVTQQVTG